MKIKENEEMTKVGWLFFGSGASNFFVLFWEIFLSDDF